MQSFAKIGQCLGIKKWEQKLLMDTRMDDGRTKDHDISPHGPGELKWQDFRLSINQIINIMNNTFTLF